MAGRSGFVRRRARVLARVSRGHGLDAEDAILPRGRQDINVRTIWPDWLAVQRPRDLDRQVTLEDGAHHGYRVAPVCWFLGDSERCDLRCDCNGYCVFQLSPLSLSLSLICFFVFKLSSRNIITAISRRDRGNEWK